MIIKGYKSKQFKSIISKLCVDDVLRDYTIVIYRHKLSAILSSIFGNGLYCKDVCARHLYDDRRIEVYTFMSKKSLKDVRICYWLFHEIYHAIQHYKYKDCYNSDIENCKVDYDNCWTEKSANSYAKHNIVKFKTKINKELEINYK